MDTKNINPVGSLVARGLALGLSFEDIAVQHGLEPSQVAKIARGNLVKQKVKELTAEIEQQLVQEAAEDPVRRYLSGKGLVAARRLVYEVDNENKETGASASTRIAASKEVLALGGHAAPQQQEGVSAVIMITASKASRAAEIAQKVVDNAPDFVDGTTRTA